LMWTQRFGKQAFLELSGFGGGGGEGGCGFGG